jgi:ubiquitin-conjugating enzyme E2 Q
MSRKRDVAASAAGPVAKAPATPGLKGLVYLVRELKRINKSGSYLIEHDDDNFFEWTVYLTPDVLQQNAYGEIVPYLVRWQKLSQRDPVIVLRISFPREYPYEVPFVRIVRPRFQYQTGHVTIGGSICTPLLTSNGWRTMDVDSLLAGLVLILKEGNARIQLKPDIHCHAFLKDYTEEEAKDAYTRVVERYGW